METKICTACAETKPLSDFGKHSSRPGGIHYYCKACVKIKSLTKYYANHEKSKEKVRAYAASRPLEVKAAEARKWRANNRERSRDHMLKTHYGLPIGTYTEMLAKQNGLCAICGTDTPKGAGQRFHVDHDHNTGEIRALLCNSCNVGIGHFHHEVKLLENAISYVTKHSLV